MLREGHCLGDQVLSFCERSAGTTHISFRSAQLHSIQALVRAGLGVSLIPVMAAAKDMPDAPVYRPVLNPVPRRAITAVWPRHRPLGKAATLLLESIAKPPAPPRRKKV